MSIDELDIILGNAKDVFNAELCEKYKERSNKPVTEADLYELTRKAFYVFDTYKQNIIEYLREL